MAQMGYQNTAGSMPYQHTAGSMGMGMGMPQMGYQNTGSMYGMMPPMASQNPMMPMNILGGSLGGRIAVRTFGRIWSTNTSFWRRRPAADIDVLVGHDR